MEGAALAVGGAVVKSACKLWLGDRGVASDISASAIDIVVGRVEGVLERRRAKRMFEDIEPLVATRLQPLINHEFRDVAENEGLAALDAVRATLDDAKLADEDLFAADLDTGYLYRYLYRSSPDRAKRYVLSAAGTAMYERVLRECCAYIVEITRTLPTFGPGVLTTILRRETEILTLLGQVLDRLPERRNTLDFTADYRQQVVNVLDRIEFFGATLTEASRRYPLSVAYISLNLASGEGNQRQWDRALGHSGDGALRTLTPTASVVDALLASRRLLIRGEAGSGKTTLLQWIAVRCGAQDLRQDRLADWSDAIPFFIRLRRYASEALPAPEHFLDDVGRHIADEMPSGWVHRQLREGSALVLVDGVDELSIDRREEARNWLRNLAAAFPNARYVVTSRPGAVGADWLGGEDFLAAEVQSMTPSDVRTFVHRWHEAVGSQSDDREERQRLVEYEALLIEAISTRRHLRSLAASPLLCALLCALHRDRRAHLPSNRMELYQVALHMLLDRRDQERGIERPPGLSMTEKVLLLQDLAFWLLLNGWAVAEKSRVVERLAAKLSSMRQVSIGAQEVCTYLVERSGILREPMVNRVDFVHRTFQEYLAAKAAVDDDEVGFLVGVAHLDQWQDTVVMAVGHAVRRRREELLAAIMDRGDNEPECRDRLHLVAIASLETSPELDVSLRSAIESRAAALLPPKTVSAARTLASAGELVLDLLTKVRARTPREVVATIRAATEIGGDAALRIIALYSGDDRGGIQRELLLSWRSFDAEEYALQVLGSAPLEFGGWVSIDDPSLLRGVVHLSKLRSLSCTFRDGYGDIEYVRSLDIGQLSVWDERLESLSPLEGKALSRLSIPTLNRVPTIGVLRTMPGLTRLEIGRTSMNMLEEIRDLRGLLGLELHDIKGLVNLDPFGFLRSPERIGVWYCAGFDSLAGIDKWAQSLKEIALGDTAVEDLSQLRSLPHLREVNLYRSRRVRDLSPLADLPTLRELFLREGPPVVDLTPFAGRNGLLVTVSPGQIVEGKELLGQGSRLTVR